LYGDDQAGRDQARSVLLLALESILKLLHPITPFVTEEIWHALPGERESIMVAPFPKEEPAWRNPAAESKAALFMTVVGGIRTIRSENMLHPSAEIKVAIVCPDPGKRAQLAELSASLMNLTRSVALDIQETGSRPKGAASHIEQDLEIFVPLAGLVDVAAESAKLEKEAGKTQGELARVQGKLNNEKFMANAPPEVVTKEREKEAELTATLARIKDNLARLEELR